MFCKYCGGEINGEKYCPNCGAKVETNEQVFEARASESENEQPARVWFVFAKVSKILGIVSISTCVIPLLAFCFTMIPGIVFSILGRKANTPETDDMCKLGLILSIIGGVIAFIMYIIVFLVIGIGAAIAASGQM